MIRAFVDSWPLFAESYLAAWAAAALLALLGVFVVARDQIFVGAAISEAAALGVAASLTVVARFAPHAHDAHDVDVWCRVAAVVFGVAAALATARPVRGAPRPSPEAVTGWLFLAAGAGAILLVSQSPFGLEEVHRLLFSSIIGATVGDVAVLGAALAALVALLAYRWRSLLLAILDPVMAEAAGLGTRRWSWGFVLALGLVVGFALRLAGLLYVLGNLVLPALVAQSLCREARSCLWVAPLTAVGASAAGFVLANAWDAPPAQMAVAVLAALVSLAWLRRAVAPRRT